MEEKIKLRKTKNKQEKDKFDFNVLEESKRFGISESLLKYLINSYIESKKRYRYGSLNPSHSLVFDYGKYSISCINFLDEGNANTVKFVITRGNAETIIKIDRGIMNLLEKSFFNF